MRAFELVSIAIHLVGRREQVGVLMQVSCKKALAMQRFAVRSNWKLILRLCHNGAALMILYSSCPQVYIHHGIRLSYFQKLYCILRHASVQSKYQPQLFNHHLYTLVPCVIDTFRDTSAAETLFTAHTSLKKRVCCRHVL